MTAAPSDSLIVDAPAKRARVMAIAAEARERLAVAAAEPARAAWLAAAPLDPAVELMEQQGRARGLDGVEAALQQLAPRFAGQAPGWEAGYGELLALGLLARLPTAEPACRLPRAAWPEIEDALRRVLEGAAASGAPGWDDEFFVKDLAVALLRFLPYGGGATRIERVTPSFLSRSGTARERLNVARVLGRRFFRPGQYVGRHQWRDFREGIRTGTTRDALTIALLAVNPEIAGFSGSGWMCDPAMREITPHLYERYRPYFEMGAAGFHMATDALSHERALATSRTRQELFAAGKYTPAVYGIILPRERMLRWGRKQGLVP